MLPGVARKVKSCEYRLCGVCIKVTKDLICNV